MSSDGESRRSMDDVLASIRKIMRGGKADLGEVPKPGSATDAGGASDEDEWALPPGAVSDEEKALAKAAVDSADSEDWSLPAGAVADEEKALEQASANLAAADEDDEDDDVLALGPAMAVGEDRPANEPAGHAPWETAGADSLAEPVDDVPADDSAELELMPDVPSTGQPDEAERDEEPFALETAPSALEAAAADDDYDGPFGLAPLEPETGDAEAAAPDDLPTDDDIAAEADMEAGDEAANEAGDSVGETAEATAEDSQGDSSEDTDDIPPPPPISSRPALSVLTGGFALGTGRPPAAEAERPATEPEAAVAEPEPEATEAPEAEPESAVESATEPADPTPALDDIEETIRRVIREELEGEIGARLSQNIRRLIRDEVARSLHRGD